MAYKLRNTGEIFLLAPVISNPKYAPAIVSVHHYQWSKDSFKNGPLATDNCLFKERPFLLRKIGKLFDK